MLASLDVHMAHAAFVDELAAAIVDLKAAGAENLERFFQRIGPFALLSPAFAAQLLAAGGSRARSCGPRLCALRGRRRNSRRSDVLGVEEFDFIRLRRGRRSR